MQNYVDNVDVFWGSRIFSRQTDGKLSKKWFFYKPQVGNLSPACTLPNSAFAVVPYSGGYPTGYGLYNPSYAAVPTEMAQENFIRGFTHFCHSGTGFIGNFYNYFMICPSADRQTPKTEKGGCGWYETETPAYNARVALDGKAANYEFYLKDNKTITLLPYFGGLDNDSKRCKLFHFPYTVEKKSTAIVFSVNVDGVTLHFSVASKDEYRLTQRDDGYDLTFETNKISLSVSYSFLSADEACERLASSCFDYATAKEIATTVWNDTLSIVDIEADERIKKLFYTALYNANKKPCIDEFVFPVFDMATLWDMYKTQMPLCFMLYPKKAAEIVNGLSACFADGYFRNGKLMTATLSGSMQAVSLMSITIATAYLLGVKADYDKLLPLAKKDVEYQVQKAKFIKPYVTHNLDLIDAFYALSACGVDFCKDVKDSIKYREKHLYAKNELLKCGLCRKFYEGTYKNYSFRVSSSTDSRLAACGSKQLSQELDSFFGFVGEDVKQFTVPTKGGKVNRYGKRYNRFEGLNNQPDMETMYLYHRLGEFAKCEDVVDELIAHNFNLTAGGLPGNDDSGGLTSWLALNILGIYPVVGTGEVLIGSPQIEKATLLLDNALTIEVKGHVPGTHVDNVVFNGKMLKDRRIAFTELKSGGKLVIEYV